MDARQLRWRLGRIWIADVDNDLIAQRAHPGIFEFVGITTDQTLDDHVAQNVSEGGPTAEELKACYIDLGTNEARIDRALELMSRIDEYVGCVEISEIKLPTMQRSGDIDTAKLASLTVKELDGNEVKLGDLFAQNKLTMVDMWATTCSVCIGSLPDLEDLSKEYADQGFGVVGVCCDVLDNDGVANEKHLSNAQSIAETAGITYPTVLADATYRDLIDVAATPTIIFVDGEGNLVEGPNRGATPKDITAQTIEANLAKVK